MPGCLSGIRSGVFSSQRVDRIHKVLTQGPNPSFACAWLHHHKAASPAQPQPRLTPEVSAILAPSSDTEDSRADGDTENHPSYTSVMNGESEAWLRQGIDGIMVSAPLAL
ncbi:hypothetical protein STEG23_033620, partial [Scotinomys teguina]